MASIHRGPNSPFYYASFRLPDGRWTKRSTGETDRERAMQVALDLASTFRPGKAVELMKRNFADALARLHGNQAAECSLRTFATRWLQAKEVTTSSNTMRAYRAAANGFIAWLGAAADKPISEISASLVTSYRLEVAQRTTARTSNNGLKVLRVMFNDARREKLLTENPAELVPVLKAPPSIRREFTAEEVRLLLKQAGEGPWRGLILAGLYTGQRLSDLAALRWRNVEFSEDRISLRAAKTKKDLRIPMHPQLRSYLEVIPRPKDADHPVWPSLAQAAAKGGVTVLSKQFHALMAGCGLVKLRDSSSTRKGIGRSVKRATNPLSFHSLRHTATTMMKLSSVSESVVMDIIGHSSRAVSSVYTHVSDDAKRAAVRSLPDV